MISSNYFPETTFWYEHKFLNTYNSRLEEFLEPVLRWNVFISMENALALSVRHLCINFQYKLVNGRKIIWVEWLFKDIIQNMRKWESKFH